MATKHVVKVLETFSKTQEIPPLMRDEEQIAPAQIKTTTYNINDQLLFPTKKWAQDFCKIHSPNVLYIGKKEVT